MLIPAHLTDEQKSVYSACYTAALLNHEEKQAAYVATLAAMQYGEKGSFLQGYKIPQEMANYTPYGASAGAGCATCWWFNSPDYCRVVEGNISPTGKSDFYLEAQTVLATLPTQTKEINTENILTKIKSFFARTDQELEHGFKTFEVDGRPLWMLFYTNPYQDGEGEFFAEKSIENDVAYMKRTGQYPELWWKHIPGTKHGQALGVWKIERFAVAVGTFDNTPLATAFQKFYKRSKGKGIGVSHGFYYYADWKQGDTYLGHHTTEVSTLKKRDAANQNADAYFLGVNLGGKSLMPLSAEDRQELLTILGDAGLVDEIATVAARKSQELDAVLARKGKGNPPPPKEEDESEEEEGGDDKKPAKKSSTDALLEQVVSGQGAILEALKALATPAPAQQPVAAVPATPAEPALPQRLQNLIDRTKATAEPEQTNLDGVQYTAFKMLGGLGGAR